MAEPWESWPVAEDSQGASGAEWQNWPVAEDGDSGPLGFLNRGIAQSAGGLVDLANVALSPVTKPLGLYTDRPFGGSESLRRGMETIGVDVAAPGERPSGYFESAMEGGGQAAGMLVPGGAAVGAATRAGGLTGRVAGDVARQFTRTPVRGTGFEVGAGFTMGAGGQAGEEIGPELGVSPETGRTIGELAGGAGLMAPAALAYTPGAALAAKAFAPFTKQGAWRRASGRLRTASGRIEDDIAAIDDPALAELTPAQRTGNERLMAIERAVRDQNPQLDELLARRMRDAVDAYKQGYREIAEGGEAFDTVRFMQERRNALNAAIDDQLMAAEARAMARLDDLSPKMRETEASEIYREELDKALAASRAQAKKLWGEVPRDVMVSTDEVKAAYRGLRDSLPEAKRRHLPEIANEFLGGGNAAFPKEVSAKELHGLYSELRTAARNAAAGTPASPPNEEMARNASILADEVLAHLESVEDVAPALRAALDFTRLQKEKFNQGVVGQVLGQQKSGGRAIPPEQTLDRGLGRAGARGAVSADELRRAVGDSPRAEQAAEQYLSRRFMQAATTDGQIDPRKAQRFLQQNDELLDRFPGLKSRMQEAVEEGSFARTAREEVETGRTEAARTPGALMSAAQRGREFEALLKNQDPQAAAKALVSEARRDPSGKALAGLKDAAARYLIGRGEDMNVQRLRDKLADPQISGAVKAVLSEGDLSRVRTTIKALENLQKAATAYGGDIVDDTPNTIMDTAFRIVGAIGGERMRAGQGGAGVGLQAAQIGSSRARQFLRWLTGDRAEKLLVDAQTDPELFKALLKNPNKVFERDSKWMRRLVGWLAAEVGAQAGEDAPEQTRANVVSMERQGAPALRQQPAITAPHPDNPQRVYGLLTGRGVPEHIAAGLVGNMMQESTPQIDPTIMGDGGNSYGALQLNGPRALAFLDWAEKEDRNPASLEAQVDYMLHELRTSERKNARRIWQAKTPEEAAKLASRFYWRPGTPHIGRRVRYARQVYQPQ